MALSVSWEPLVRGHNHEKFMNEFERIIRGDTGRFACAFEGIVVLGYGLSKFDLEWMDIFGSEESKKISVAKRIVSLLDGCDMTDKEMWDVARVTRPFIWSIIQTQLQTESIKGTDLYRVGKNSSITAPRGFSSNSFPRSATGWDIGAADGKDSAYLLTLTDRVIAVEPNPPAVSYLFAQLANEVSAGKLHVVPSAIVPRATRTFETIPFHSNPHHAQASRIALDESTELLRVPATDCASLAIVFGVPWIVKIDSEDGASPCLSDLCDAGAAPVYASIETTEPFMIDSLVACGFKHFKLVSQAGHSIFSRERSSLHREFSHNLRDANTTIYLSTSSGLLGEDALDWVSGPVWRTPDQVKADMALIGQAKCGQPGSVLNRLVLAYKWNGFDWFDLHAKRR